jgi:DNA-binding NarL/FixJ family response regulator
MQSNMTVSYEATSGISSSLSAAAALSTQEIRILELAAIGYADKEIAVALRVTHSTVRTYWERIRSKSNAKNRTHAVCWALAIGAIASPLEPSWISDARTRNGSQGSAE